MLRCIFLMLFLLVLSCNREAGKQESQEIDRSGSAAELEKREEGVWQIEEDAAFLEEVYSFNLLLSRYNQLASTKGTSLSIQDFGRQSARYFRALNQEIEIKAGKRDLELSLPADIEEDNKEQIRKLEATSGNAFDRQYLQVLADLQEDLTGKYEEASKSAGDMDLRNWSGKIASNLEAHQMTVQELLEEIENK